MATGVAVITIDDIMLAIVLLGPEPRWYRPLKRRRWRKGMVIIRQASASMVAAHQAWQRIEKSLNSGAPKKAQDQWGVARVEDGEVN